MQFINERKKIQHLWDLNTSSIGCQLITLFHWAKKTDEQFLKDREYFLIYFFISGVYVCLKNDGDVLIRLNFQSMKILPIENKLFCSTCWFNHVPNNINRKHRCMWSEILKLDRDLYFFVCMVYKLKNHKLNILCHSNCVARWMSPVDYIHST